MSAWTAGLAWIEASPLGEALRSYGVWTYGVTNLVHIIGIATLFGSILILDLRLLGVRSSTPIPIVASLTAPLAVAGFCLAVLSGICLLAVNGSEYATNPFLPIKFSAIALGLINAFVLHRTKAWRAIRAGNDGVPKSLQLRAMGGVSLACWLTAIGAGRMIGYW